jgi:hypothetical protein
MKLFLQKLYNRKVYLLAIFSIVLINSCKERDNTLAPYTSSTSVSRIIVEDNTYTPKITWVGGYASVVGVNRGNNAALDSSLVWLIYQAGNSIHYPVTYPQTPAGASDLTQQFGGNTLPKLIEDNTYTYWVMKEDIWNQISSQKNKVLKVDSSLTSGYQINADTISISMSSYFQIKKNIDKFVNIYEISYFGSPDIILGVFNIIQTDTSNTPIIQWKVTQLGVTDTLISALGIVEGAQYDASKVIWEIYSEETVNGAPVYGKKNVIPSPIYPGTHLNETFTFKEYPVTGLERNKGYYIWMAAKQWDQINRFRITPYYAYITFKTR